MSLKLVEIPRTLSGLRAAHLNGRVVVTGGYKGNEDEELLVGDEVSFGILLIMIILRFRFLNTTQQTTPGWK